jgi:hypothetical protein
MARDTTRSSNDGLMHAGAGTGLALVQLSVLIPGLLPSLALLGVFVAVLALPLVALTLVVGVLATPPVGVWLLARRIRSASNPTRSRT